MRLIDADALKEAMQEHTDCRGYLVCDPEEIIDLAPTEERPRGTWTEEFDESANPFFQRRWRCSACHDYNYYGRPDFCPCCGADMRKKEGDEK